MQEIIVEYNDFENQKLWESFIAFFRYVKGYDDWTDEQIALSMNKDDFKEYCEWAKGILGIEVE